MRFRILTILSLLLITTSLLSQPLQIVWQNCYGGPGYDWAYDLIRVDDGYFIAGTTNSDSATSNYHGADDGWLVKIDSVGNLIWETCYGGTKGDGIFRILDAQNDDFFLVGNAYSSDGSVSNDNYPDSHDYWVVKINKDGNILWDRIVGGNSHEQVFNATSTSDGGVIVTGYTTSSDGDISYYYGSWDAWFIKLNSDGSTDWDFTFGKSLHPDVGTGVIQTSSGEYLVGGYAQPEGIGNITCVPHNWYAEGILFKLDTNGKEVWQQCYGGSGHDAVNDILELKDGYLLIAGTSSDDGDVSGFHGTPGDSYDIWIIKTDFFGNITWEKCYGGSDIDFAKKVFQTSDGGFVVFGITNSFNGDVSGNHSLDNLRPSIWVFKIDSIGNLLWQQCFGGIARERVHYGVVKKSDKNFVIAGEMSYGPSFDVGCYNQNPGGKPDFWVFEVIDTSTNSIAAPKLPELKVYPNPASEYLNIEFSQAFSGKMQFELYDCYGRKVKDLKITKPVQTISLTEIIDGMYFYRLKSETELLCKGKVLVVR